VHAITAGKLDQVPGMDGGAAAEVEAASGADAEA
jgi:hypothetical protein